MRHITILLLVLLALAFGPSMKADSISQPVPLGIVNATIGITPIEDSSSGLGRFFLSYVLDGSYNAFVFWISSNDPSGEPFLVSNGQITFLPGAHDYFVGGVLLETLSISSTEICCADNFSFNRGEFVFTLPSTDTLAAGASGSGDEFYIYNVPMVVSEVPALPEPSALLLLGIGLGSLVIYGSLWGTRERCSMPNASAQLTPLTGQAKS